jgi:hypothetical protein
MMIGKEINSFYQLSSQLVLERILKFKMLMELFIGSTIKTTLSKKLEKLKVPFKLAKETSTLKTFKTANTLNNLYGLKPVDT